MCWEQKSKRLLHWIRGSLNCHTKFEERNGCNFFRMSVSRCFINFVVSNKGRCLNNCEPVRRNPCFVYKVYGLSETFELLITKYSDHYEWKLFNL
jgi:hypothetical protein